MSTWLLQMAYLPPQCDQQQAGDDVERKDAAAVARAQPQSAHQPHDQQQDRQPDAGGHQVGYAVVQACEKGGIQPGSLLHMLTTTSWQLLSGCKPQRQRRWGCSLETLSCSEVVSAAGVPRRQWLTAEVYCVQVRMWLTRSFSMKHIGPRSMRAPGATGAGLLSNAAAAA